MPPMHILVINAGSSSLKYQLLAMPEERVLCGGLVERIGESTGRIHHEVAEGAAVILDTPIRDHGAGLRQVADLLMREDDSVLGAPATPAAVGHRVVHGGEAFSAPAVIDTEVKETIRALIPLAPLHNPSNLAGIEVAESIFPDAHQVAVFDTAFHQSMPEHAFRYAVPADLYMDHGIRVYGFHGTSHGYVAAQTAALLGKPVGRCNLITAHLGNGASITAIRNGRSVDTSMGFSPLPGLVMGTRSGDLDPAVVFYLHREMGLTLAEIDSMLNRRSGLLGICGDNDMRDIERRVGRGEPDACLALEMYAYRIRKYVGAYVAVLGGVDALIFTAGVGENSALVRAQVCEGLESLGIVLDARMNNDTVGGKSGLISTDDARIDAFVIPTNEEAAIARQTYQLLAIDSVN